MRAPFQRSIVSLSILISISGASSLRCTEKGSSITAKRITSRTDLIGGPGALGDVGDFLLANERIRVIVQGSGYSRGFGIYGGSLIDADLQRPHTAGDSSGGRGFDNFSELFPTFFLKAMRPRDDGISVVQGDDGSASVVVSGKGADFVFLAKRVNDLLIDSDNLVFRNEYTLRPGKRYVEITTTIINQGDSAVDFPGSGIASLLKGAELELPVGDVILFGQGNDVFSETAGFDLRFTLERLYKDAPSLPKLPGLVTPFLATRGNRVSYGFMSGVDDPERSFVSRAGYEGVRIDSLVVPFIASAFTGAFHAAAPRSLGPREAFSYKKYFIVGDGDVASIRDVVHEIRRDDVGIFSGVVRDIRTQAAEAGVHVVAFDESGSPYNQHTTDSAGQFIGNYARGRYTFRVVARGRSSTEPEPFEIRTGGTTHVEVSLSAPGYIAVRTRGEDGRLLPARCSLVGQYPKAAAGFDPKEFLYDLKLGEPMRHVDFERDTEDPRTREFIEHIVYAAGGQKTDPVRPGKYRVVCSRGPEYDTFTEEVVVSPGERAEVDAVLHRVVNTGGWAAGDFHLHADNSVDSALSLEDRVAACAGEGLDLAVASDHNFVTDYAPTIAGLGLESFIQGIVGLELTTIEIGHFNGFPLLYDPGPITKGSFEWSGRPPQDLINDLRALGRYGPEQTIVQVNHPRDTVLGYFNDYNFNPDTGLPEAADSLLSAEGPEFGPERFSFDFDAMEVFNGKRFDLVRTFRVPRDLPEPPLPENIPAAGEILRDTDGRVAFPGAMEDWFTLLNQGRIVTGMGNSDSHYVDDEPGIPRSYLEVGDDTPGAIDERDVIGAIKNQRVMVTNGPFLRVTARADGNGTKGCRTQQGVLLSRSECGLGEVVDGTAGRVTLRIENEMAPWISIDTVSVIWRGVTVKTFAGDNFSLASLEHTLEVDGDGWIIVEVKGSKSMWPVITPNELPSIQVDDALSSIASAFNFELTSFGNLHPSETSVVYAYAFTNPIFVDADGDGAYDAPGVQAQALSAASAPRLPGVKRRDLRDMPVLVKLFAAFAGH